MSRASPLCRAGTIYIFFRYCIHMRGGLACLSGSLLDSGEISAVPGSCEVSQRASPLYRARNCHSACSTLHMAIHQNSAQSEKEVFSLEYRYGRDPN